MDYSQLSDFEINKLVANATGTQVEETYQFVNGGEDIADHMSGIVLMRKITSNRKHWKIYDPCNSPEDAWPIIHDNRISLVIDDTTDEWSSALVNDFSDDMAFQHSNANKNPLRAAMITFLLIQESQHA